MNKLMTVSIYAIVIVVATLIYSCSIIGEKKQCSNVNLEKSSSSQYISPANYAVEWNCGIKNCNSLFTWSQLWGDGISYAGYQTKRDLFRDEFGYHFVTYNVKDNVCELLDSITVDSSHVAYKRMQSFEVNLRCYQGEKAYSRISFDGPLSLVVWGDQDRCKMAWDIVSLPEFGRLIHEIGVIMNEVKNQKSSEGQ